MNAELDPVEQAILEQAPEGMFGAETEPTPEGLYGEGTHKGVELLEVITYPKSEHGFGYRIGLKGYIKDSLTAPGYEYTAKFDLERTLEANGHEPEDWKQAKEEKKRKFLNDALQAFGFNRPVEAAIDTEAQYDTLVNIFRQKTGQLFDMKVVPDGKNSKDADGNWTFTPNGYTRVAWIKKTRAARK